MTLLDEALDEKKFDIRNLERKISRNTIDKSIVDESLKNLPDDADNATYTRFDDIEKVN